MRDGSRPWAWWVFEQGEAPPQQQPGANVIRLAELGELSEAESAGLAKRAAEAKALIESGTPRNYVATGQGRCLDHEREAIDLWERVQKTLRHPHRDQAG